jgi:hypothetical protein
VAAAPPAPVPVVATSPPADDGATSTRAPASDARPRVALGGGATERLPPATNPVFWEDAVGDVSGPKNDPRRPVVDVSRVEIAAAGEALVVRIAVNDGLDRYLGYTDAAGNRYAGLLLELYVDRDDDRTTGGSPVWSGEADRVLAGYEAAVSLALAQVTRRDGVEALVTGDGPIPAADIAGTGGNVTIWRLGGDPLPVALAEDARRAVKITATGLEATIPYEWLALTPGKVVRVCFRDTFEGRSSGKTFSSDKLLAL